MGRPLRSILLVAASLFGAGGCDANDRSPTALRVMTYNIHYGDPDLSRIAAVICEAGADVVGLQEMDVHWGERSRFADQAADLAPLFAHMRDAWAGNVDPGFTFPAGAPARRIDYVFVGGALVVTRARVLETAASDHRPVLADLVLGSR